MDRRSGHGSPLRSSARPSGSRVPAASRSRRKKGTLAAYTTSRAMAQASERAEMWAAAGVCELVGQGRDQQGGDDEHEQGGVEARFLRVEALGAVAERRRR